MGDCSVMKAVPAFGRIKFTCSKKRSSVQEQPPSVAPPLSGAGSSPPYVHGICYRKLQIFTQVSALLYWISVALQFYSTTKVGENPTMTPPQPVDAPLKPTFTPSQWMFSTCTRVMMPVILRFDDLRIGLDMPGIATPSVPSPRNA